ncbi:MAG: hypothetical protein PHE61_07205 [Candidatus Omnitrophica bacterium]|nr:hypothetical protein [Candidatus Omnitrophota bacterium]
MREDVRSLIRKYYPGPVYCNPLERPEVSAAVAPQRKFIYQIIGEIRSKVERANLEHASGEPYDLSEEITIRGDITLRVSYLGPFAHLNTGDAKNKYPEVEFNFIIIRIREVLSRYELLLLSGDEVNEVVPWLAAGASADGGKVSVWNCLFREF